MQKLLGFVLVASVPGLSLSLGGDLGLRLLATVVCAAYAGIMLSNLVGVVGTAKVVADGILVQGMVGAPHEIAGERVLAIETSAERQGLVCVSVYEACHDGSVRVHVIRWCDQRAAGEFLRASAVRANARGNRPHALPRRSRRSLAPSLALWAVGPFLVSCAVSAAFHVLGWRTLLCVVPALVASSAAHASSLAVLAAARRNRIPPSFRPWFQAIERLPASPGPVAGPYRGPVGVLRTRG